MANLQISPEFQPIKQEVSVQLDDSLSGFNKEDLEALVEGDAKKIAQAQGRNPEELVQAISEGEKSVMQSYVPGLNPSFAFEPICTLEGMEYNNDVRATMKVNVTTGLMAKAIQSEQYKAQFGNIHPIVVQGMVLTEDNKILMGIRSKPDFRADQPDEPNDYKLQFMPAGYATLGDRGDPLKQAFFKELKQELNLSPLDIISTDIVGYNRDVGFTEGVRLTYLTITELSSTAVRKRWQSAKDKNEITNLVTLDYHPASARELLKPGGHKMFEGAKGLIHSSIVPPLSVLANNQQYR